MSLSSLKSAAKRYWQKRIVRILVAVLVLAIAVYAQYLLARIPLPVDVEKSKPAYTPISAELIKQEELVIKKPSLQRANNTPEMVILNDDGSDLVTVVANFSSARLHDESLNLLKNAKKPLPAPGLQRMVYVTEGESESTSGTPAAQPSPARPSAGTNSPPEPCRTFVNVLLAQRSQLPSEIHFHQVTGPGTTRYRTFEMKAIGADLVVELLTRNLKGDFTQPGCTKTLTQGDWSTTFASPVPLKILMPAGSSLEFYFTPFRGKTAWQGTNGSFEAFELEASPLGVQSINKLINNQLVFSATSSKDANPLLLKHLSIGSSELQIDYAGEALVEENGKPAVTFDLWEFIKKNPLLAGVLAMLDAALLEWIRRIILKSPT